MNENNDDNHAFAPPVTSVDQKEASGHFPALMTEAELIRFLRIPEVSNSRNHHNVIEPLKRHRDLPRVHVCNKALYPVRALQKWIEEQTINGK